MATLTIRDLDDRVRDRLRVRAARNGRSMEAEVRAILAAEVQEEDGSAPTGGLGSRIHLRFAELDIDLPLPERIDMPRVVELEA